MSAKVAAKKPALMHEAMGIMLADCFQYHVNLIAGDANMATCQTGAQNRDLHPSATCVSRRWFASISAPTQPHSVVIRSVALRRGFVSSNPLTLLRWMEDKFGIPWKDVGAMDWAKVPSLDCMVACVLEWSHSVPMDRRSETADPTYEYKICVSEWLLHSNRETYLLADSENDSHTPLLIHLRPTWMSNKERPESIRTP